jgi:hypothetical protein
MLALPLGDCHRTAAEMVALQFSLPFQQERNGGKQRIEDQRRDCECSIRRNWPADKSVPGLDQNQHGAERDDAGLTRD